MKKINSNKLKQPSVAIAWPALAMLLSMPVHTAFAAGGDALDEIVVTAQKREENLQDVGISIAAFGEDQLKNMGVTTTDQLAGMVPGVQIFQRGCRFAIRVLPPGPMDGP